MLISLDILKNKQDPSNFRNGNQISAVLVEGEFISPFRYRDGVKRSFDLPFSDRIEKLQNDYATEKSKSDSTGYLANQLKNKNDSLKISNLILNEKLSKANTIRISRLNVYPIREKNGVQEIVNKAKKTVESKYRQ